MTAHVWFTIDGWTFTAINDDSMSPANDTDPAVVFTSSDWSALAMDAVWLIPPSMTIAPGDRIHVETPPDDPGQIIFDYTWSGTMRDKRRVWHNGQELDATVLRKVTRDGEGLEIVTGSQRAYVAPDNESAPGMFSGTVEKVEGV